MKKLLISAGLLVVAICNTAYAFNVDGKYIKVGDHLSVIYDRWGSPQYRITSDKTCHAYKPNECSYSRLVWKRGDTFYIVQEIRANIIKTKTTRNEKDIRKAF